MWKFAYFDFCLTAIQHLIWLDIYELSIPNYQMGFRNDELETQFRTGESIHLTSFNLINIKTCSKIMFHVDCCLVDEVCKKAREINYWGRSCVSFNIMIGCRTIIFTSGNKTVMSLEACQASLCIFFASCSLNHDFFYPSLLKKIIVSISFSWWCLSNLQAVDWKSLFHLWTFSLWNLVWNQFWFCLAVFAFQYWKKIWLVWSEDTDFSTRKWKIMKQQNIKSIANYLF